MALALLSGKWHSGKLACPSRQKAWLHQHMCAHEWRSRHLCHVAAHYMKTDGMCRVPAMRRLQRLPASRNLRPAATARRCCSSVLHSSQKGLTMWCLHMPRLWLRASTSPRTSSTSKGAPPAHICRQHCLCVQHAGSTAHSKLACQVLRVFVSLAIFETGCLVTILT